MVRVERAEKQAIDGLVSCTAHHQAGRRARLAKVDNFVDGAAVAEIGAEPFRQLSQFSADSVRLIPENRLCATMIEMLTAFALLTAYLSSFVDWYGRSPSEREAPGDR